MLKQRVRLRRIVWIGSGKPRHGTVWSRNCIRGQ